MAQRWKKAFQKQNLPIAKNEDVEFSAEIADAQDLEAQERAALADARQEQE
ncbi:YfhD family protein [Paenibacillus sp. YYML68]|uniref:YfhD family protein n=1 Tax=Paenibacillus sp. YYML68 TaxID=2909250 RepID=UPI0024927069|nr:YfhD family protein [Paenibacillus sp. YYML68]